MDFFAAQDSARRRTSLLVVLFLLAVLSIIIITSLVLMVIIALSHTKSGIGGHTPFFNGEIFLGTGLVILIIVGIASWYKMNKLASGGGDGVAHMLGGEPVFADDKDFHRKRLVNIIEEMAIAAGMPVPQPYVLPERSINAFAAGYGHSDAVVVVTQGALNHLSREQLQGVIAHEFSHILNADMRINIRIMGVLHGILVLGFLGRTMLYGNRSKSSRNGGGVVIIGAIALIIMGYIGTFFGNIIKAAVNRQREFLADAAAVQFTRNPEGIGGALLQIGGLTYGAKLSHPKAEEVSHLFFAQALSSLSSLFATHPPLPIRIKRILPAWDGKFPSFSEKPENFSPTPLSSQTMGFSEGDFSSSPATPGKINITKAQEILYTIPPSVHKGARDPFVSRALIVFLLLDPDDKIRKQQLRTLANRAERGIKAETVRLLKNGLVLSRELHLPVLELVLPSLRRLSDNQCHQFLTTLKTLIIEDNKIDLFEWCILTIVTEYIKGMHGQASRPSLKRETVDTRRARYILLSYLCYISANDTLSAQALFTRNRTQLHLSQTTIHRADTLSMKELSNALHHLRNLIPEKKKEVFQVCHHIVLADNQISIKEAEMLRAIAAAMDIPHPPLS